MVGAEAEDVADVEGVEEADEVEDEIELGDDALEGSVDFAGVATPPVDDEVLAATVPLDEVPHAAMPSDTEIAATPAVAPAEIRRVIRRTAIPGWLERAEARLVFGVLISYTTPSHVSGSVGTREKPSRPATPLFSARSHPVGRGGR